MKLLLLTENWPPRIGGIENYLTHIAAYLPKGDVTVVAPIGSSGHSTQKVVTKRFFSPFIWPAWSYLLLWIRRKVKRGEVDILLCGKALFEGLLAYYLKRFTDIPYIVCTYAMEIEEWKKNTRTCKKLERVIQHADAVMYINEGTRQSLVELGAKESQLVKVWPGVDERFLKRASRIDVIAKYNISQPYILTVARLIERKGIDDLIEAFSNLDQVKYSDVQLVVVGSGPEKEHLKEIAKQMFVEGSVHFLGFVPDEDLPALYTGAKLFALTPKNIDGDFEGFGIAYLEAAACGIPAVATDASGAAEAVVDGITGLVVKLDTPRVITESLERLLSDDDLCKRLGSAARKRVVNEFRWSNRVKIVENIINERASRSLS